MPNNVNAGVRRDAWSRCDRCGRDYPLGEMQMQNGLLLCNSTCWDNPLAFYRQNIITAKLSDGRIEFDDETGKKRSEDQSQWYTNTP